MASWENLALFFLFLLNFIFFSVSRTIHQNLPKRKAAVKGAKKQTMYLPDALSMSASQYGQNPAQSCCPSHVYPSQYPVQSGPQPQQSCCNSSNPSPPPCCMNLKPEESKKINLNSAGKNYLLTVNLGAKGAGGPGGGPGGEPGGNKSKDASPTSFPQSSQLPTNSGPTSKPTSSGGSSTSSPTTGVPVNLNGTSSPKSTANTTSPSATPSQGLPGSSLTSPSPSLPGSSLKTTPTINLPGSNNDRTKNWKKQAKKELEIFVGAPLFGTPQHQINNNQNDKRPKNIGEKGRPNENAMAKKVNKLQDDACMEGAFSMCGQQSVPYPSDPCATPQGMSPCPQAVSMPSPPQQTPCQQASAASMSCPPQQTAECAPQAINPCPPATPVPCTPPQGMNPCCQTAPCIECNTTICPGGNGTTQGNGTIVGPGGGNGTGAGNKTKGNTGGNASVRPSGGAAAPKGSCRQQTLEAHNVLRPKHIAPLLKLNAAMNEGARKYAQVLATTDNKNLPHSPQNQRPGQGENLAYTCNKPAKPYDCKAITNKWYSEVKLYNWNNPGFAQSTGHFTQLVWKATTEIGVGLATFKDKLGQTCHVMVTRYKPQGNIPGQFKQNVLRGKA